MPRFKSLCTCLLAAVLLIPAISAHDDAIRLSTFQSGINADADSLVSVHGLPKAELDSTLAALLEGLDTLQVGDACNFQFDFTSAPFRLNDESRGCNRSVAAPVGRAPPA